MHIRCQEQKRFSPCLYRFSVTRNSQGVASITLAIARLCKEVVIAITCKICARRLRNPRVLPRNYRDAFRVTEGRMRTWLSTATQSRSLDEQRGEFLQCFNGWRCELNGGRGRT